jgi:tRNA (guanine37-N1)-methyltransferase
MSLRIDVITIFPGMLDGFLGESMLKRAVEKGAVEFNVVNLRDFSTDTHQTTDDRPYGGGPGMVMKPEPLFDAINSLKSETSRVILMTPRGTPFKQSKALDLAKETHIIFVCGHYEGIDERVNESLVDEGISIGDYILTNGVLPAAVVIDSVVRLLPGVLGGEGATDAESFMDDGLLEYPHYTRPADYNGLTVPNILLSGNHAEIARWRKEQAYKITKNIRPDLLDK